MIRTIFHKQYWKILHLFYDNRNHPLHLRDISRKIGLKESAISLHLNSLEKGKVLHSFKEANLKKYSVEYRMVSRVFPIYDQERLEKLPLLRKNAIKEYLAALSEKPILLILFGSTVKGSFTDDSDIDLLQVSSSKSSMAKRHAEAVTGMKLQILQITEEKFYKELKMKEDHVIQAALGTGFPVFNREYYYDLTYGE